MRNCFCFLECLSRTQRFLGANFIGSDICSAIYFVNCTKHFKVHIKCRLFQSGLKERKLRKCHKYFASFQDWKLLPTLILFPQNFFLEFTIQSVFSYSSSNETLQAQCAESILFIFILGRKLISYISL